MCFFEFDRLYMFIYFSYLDFFFYNKRYKFVSTTIFCSCCTNAVCCLGFFPKI